MNKNDSKNSSYLLDNEKSKDLITCVREPFAFSDFSGNWF